MGHHDDGRFVLARQPEQDLVEPLAVGVVEVPRRLVRQHQAGIVHQRPRHRAALLLPARQLRRPVGHAPGEPNDRQQLLGPRTGLARSPPPDQEGHHHVLQRGEFPQEMVELEDEPQLTVPELGERRRIQVGIAGPVEPDVSPGRPIQRPQEVQQGALPGSRRAHNRHELATADLEVHAAQHLERLAVTASEHLPDAPGREQGRHS